MTWLKDFNEIRNNIIKRINAFSSKTRFCQENMNSGRGGLATPGKTDRLGFNVTFSTVRLYCALKIYSLVKRLISLRQLKILRFGECTNMCESWELGKYCVRLCSYLVRVHTPGHIHSFMATPHFFRLRQWHNQTERRFFLAYKIMSEKSAVPHQTKKTAADCTHESGTETLTVTIAN